MAVWSAVLGMLQGGFGSLAAYLAAHVLLCLFPAFLIAGALTALVPQESITRYLGRSAKKWVSYPVAALGGFVLAVCSCTIMPLFAGIYRRGAGIGPAITFLFVGPAICILGLSYTGVALGMDIAIARLVLAILFGLGLGLIMALLFRRQDREHADARAGAFVGQAGFEGRVGLFLLLLLALLLVGTLQVGMLSGTWAEINLPIPGVASFQQTLDRLVPYDASRGEEGVSVQGVVLIAMLGTIAASAWRGLSHVDEGFNRWTWVALGLGAATLLLAAVRLEPVAGGARLLLTGRMVAVGAVMAALATVAARRFEAYELQEWLWETWRFVRQIFPLLLVGVFAVGVIRGLIRPEWIQTLAGRNTMLANLVGVIFGVFMYFPTLVEVVVASMFLDLGMHRGPLLAYLMSDPVMSLQAILILITVIGKLRTWVYVGWVALFSTLAGLIYGAWVDGASPWMLLGYLALGLAALIMALNLVGRRQARSEAAISGATQERAR